MTSRISNLEAALGYHAAGRSVIPAAPGGKLPALPTWKRYQTERATPDRIEHWWQHTPGFNVGIVTGQISGVVVVDVDLRKPEAADTMAMIAATLDLPPTPEVTTATGGIHLWYAHPGSGVRIPNSSKQFASGFKTPGVDVRGDGGFAVCPPSTRPEGAYSWCEWLCDLAPLPPSLLEHLVERQPALAEPAAPWRQRIEAARRPVRSSYVEQAIGDELTELEREGGHGALTRSAYRLGQLHAIAGMNDTQVEQLVEQLADAALVNAGGDRSKTAALKTARECYDAGKDNPRTPK
jgi:Bifunctional DNA primase/polymerase, N-terminal